MIVSDKILLNGEEFECVSVISDGIGYYLVRNTKTKKKKLISKHKGDRAVLVANNRESLKVKKNDKCDIGRKLFERQFSEREA